VEEAKFGQQVGEEEVERTEAHHGHDVRRVGQEGVAGDGEHGGDGVKREDDIGDLDGDESEEENRNHAASVFAGEELVLAQADGVDAVEPFDPARSRLGLLGGGKNEPDGGDQQDASEDVADPLEVREEIEAGGDKGSAHDDGAGDSPEQHPGLMAGVDVESSKKNQEDEEVVDGERLFDGIAGEVLGRVLSAQGMEDEEGEGKSGGDPENGGGDRGGVGSCGALAACVDKLDREEREDEEVKSDPVADGGGAGHLFWMLQRGRAGCTDGGVAWFVRQTGAGGQSIAVIP